jgi:membrane protein implicated in regulation of membrane protease activity
MGVGYLFALVAALGVLLVQILMAGHGGHGDVGAGHGDVGHGDVGHGHGQEHAQGEHNTGGAAAVWTLFLSLRFWTFAALGFGLSGSLLHFLGLAGPAATAVIAVGAGVGSGVFATLAFRAVKRGSTGTESRSSLAVGKTGRVVVACGRGVKGQVRIELAGSSVDLVATTDEETIAHGESVLVEDLHEGVAHVSRRPRELG